jgi:urate oxidase
VGIGLGGNRCDGERRTATVTRAGDRAWVVAGLAGLLVLKTTGSGFQGFLRDRCTTRDDAPPAGPAWDWE